jgi:hypothetical protein
MKRISVVTAVLCPSEEALEVIKKCMISVRKAVDKVNGEYIIVNDNSAIGGDFFDEIADLCIKNASTLGVSISLNLGMFNSNGDFVVKLDSDYLVPENLFEVMLKDWSDDCAFISPSYLLSRPENKELLDVKKLPKIEGGVYERPPGMAGEYIKSKYQWGGGILMFDKKKIEEIGYFDESFGIGGAQDNDVIYRLLDKGYNWKWDNNVVTRHFSSISSTDKKSTQDYTEIRKIGVQRYKEKYGCEPGSFISKIYQKFNYKFII